MTSRDHQDDPQQDPSRSDADRAALADAHRKVKGALRELHLAFEQLDKLKETW